MSTVTTATSSGSTFTEGVAEVGKRSGGALGLVGHDSGGRSGKQEVGVTQLVDHLVGHADDVEVDDHAP